MKDILRVLGLFGGIVAITIVGFVIFGYASIFMLFGQPDPVFEMNSFTEEQCDVIKDALEIPDSVGIMPQDISAVSSWDGSSFSILFSVSREDVPQFEAFIKELFGQREEVNEKAVLFGRNYKCQCKYQHVCRFRLLCQYEPRGDEDKLYCISSDLSTNLDYDLFSMVERYGRNVTKEREVALNETINSSSN